MKSRLYKLLFEVDFEYLEIFSGFSGLGWGLALLLSPDLFQTSRIYLLLRVILPNQYIWAALAGLGGLSQIIAVYFNTERRLQLRRISTLFSIFFWIFVAALLEISFYSIDSHNILNTGTVIYSLIALASAWSFIRLTIIKRYVDRK